MVAACHTARYGGSYGHPVPVNHNEKSNKEAAKSLPYPIRKAKNHEYTLQSLCRN